MQGRVEQGRASGGRAGGGDMVEQDRQGRVGQMVVV